MSPLVICLFVAAGAVVLMGIAPLFFPAKKATTDAAAPVAPPATAPSPLDGIKSAAATVHGNVHTWFAKAKADLEAMEKQMAARTKERQDDAKTIVESAANQLDNLYHEAAQIVDTLERDEALKKLADTAAVVLPALIKAGVILPK